MTLPSAPPSSSSSSMNDDAQSPYAQHRQQQQRAHEHGNERANRTRKNALMTIEITNIQMPKRTAVAVAAVVAAVAVVAAAAAAAAAVHPMNRSIRQRVHQIVVGSLVCLFGLLSLVFCSALCVSRCALLPVCVEQPLARSFVRSLPRPFIILRFKCAITNQSE